MSSLKGDRIFHEIVGIFLIALTIFLFLSLVTYSSSDPCLDVSRRGGAVANQKVKNLAGPAGAVVADILIQFFGITAFFIPVLTLFLGLKILCLSPINKKWSVSFGTILFFLSTPSLLSIIYAKAEITMFSKTLAFSGWLGRSIAYDLLKPRLGQVGIALLLGTVWITSVIMVTHISIIGLLNAMRECFYRLGFILRLKFRNKSEVIKQPFVFANTKKEPRDSRSKREKTTVTKQEAEEVRLERNRHKLLPPFSILKKADKTSQKKAVIDQEITNNSRLLESKLLDFGIEGRVVQVHPGPVITRYEFEPAPGIKINRIANLSDDLALAMKAQSVRIVAPVPGKAVVGLEIPNLHREIVVLRDILTSKEFRASNSKLSLALGKDIAGKPYVTDLSKMPHLLIAGSTGSGKSVTVNSIICSILFNATSDEVKFLMVDPKRLELGIYNDIPHLLVPVVMEPKQAANALKWATEEMDQRYHILAEKGVRNIDQYNALIENNPFSTDENAIGKLPFIVIVIDEFADLILMAGREIESLLTRLAQMARAVGIHLVIATQRPSVDIITGLIKANFPCRISFRVSSKTDSRTIIDTNGAEKLLGMGDMLFLPPGVSTLVRVHGSAVTEEEINASVAFLRQQAPPDYDISIVEDHAADAKYGDGYEEYDELYDKAVDLVVSTNKASISMIQRRLKIGYNRAARMIEIMEKDGVVSKPEGSKPRQVLVRKEHETI